MRMDGKHQRSCCMSFPRKINFNDFLLGVLMVVAPISASFGRAVQQSFLQRKAEGRMRLLVGSVNVMTCDHVITCKQDHNFSG